MSLPRLTLAIDLEGSAAPEIYALHAGDEARLLEDLSARRGDLGRELLAALDAGLDLLEARTARLREGDLGRRAA